MFTLDVLKSCNAIYLWHINWFHKEYKNFFLAGTFINLYCIIKMDCRFLTRLFYLKAFLIFNTDSLMITFFSRCQLSLCYLCIASMEFPVGILHHSFSVDWGTHVDYRNSSGADLNAHLQQIKKSNHSCLNSALICPSSWFTAKVSV